MAWNDIPAYEAFAAWESGNYPIALTDFEITTTKPESGNKLMFALEFTVQENDHPSLQSYIGKTCKDWAVIGMDNDPAVQDEDTLENVKNLGVQKLKALIVAAECEPDGAADLTVDMLHSLLDDATGVPVIGRVKRRGKGMDAQHSINGYLKMGEVQIGTLGTPEPKAAQKKTSFKPQLKAVDGGKAGAKAVAEKLLTQADYEDAELADAEKPIHTEKPAKAAKKVKAAKTLTCPLGCGSTVAYDNLASHVAGCSGEASDDDDE